MLKQGSKEKTKYRVDTHCFKLKEFWKIKVNTTKRLDKNIIKSNKNQ